LIADRAKEATELAGRLQKVDVKATKDFAANKSKIEEEAKKVNDGLAELKK